MNCVDVNPSTYIDFGIENNDKDPKFKVGGNIIISKFKNIFAKGYASKWSKEDFKIKKVKNSMPSTYLISDLNGEEIAGTFHEK